MADDFESLWNSTPAAGTSDPAPIPVAAETPALTFDSLWQSTPAAPVSDGGYSAIGEIGQGLTFGFLPEIEGGVSGLSNALANVLGGGNSGSFMENYRAKRDQSEAELKQFEKENPWGSLGLQVAGGALPATAGGIAQAGFGAAKASPSLLSTLARNVFGIGFEEAPTLVQLAKMGATSGALYGAGNAEEGDRLQGAATGGVVGAIAAPVVGKTIEVGTNIAADKLAEWGLLRPGMLAGETGSIGLGGKTVDNSFSPEELLLAKQLKNTPIEKITQGANELGQAIDQNIPLFLPEAVGSPKVDRNARFIANYEPSLEFSQTAIGNRTADAESRAIELLRAVSPESDAYQGASKLAEAAAGIIKDAGVERQNIADPLYRAAYKTLPTITDPALTTLLEKDQALNTAIKSVQKTANNADLPLNSTELLVKARSEIGNKIDAALEKGASREARDLTDTYNRLNNILHDNNEPLKLADKAYEIASGKIEALNDTFLKNLSSLTDDKLQNVGQIFNLPKERISQLRNTFEKAGRLNEWNAGVRSHLQNVVEGSKEGTNFADKLIGTTLKEGKLQAALGESYDDVIKGLTYESRFAAGKNKYHAGSSTKGNFDEASEFERGVGFISKLVSGNYKDAIAGLFKGDMPEEIAQGLAKIYFDPKKGGESLNKILPLLEQYAKNKSFSSLTGTITGGAASREAADISGNLLPKSEKTQISLLEKVVQEKPKESLAAMLSSVVGIPEASATENITRGGDVDLTKEEIPAFGAKVDKIAKNLGADPQHLLAVMKFETGGSLSSSEKNKAGSGATGLIQFMPSTAKELTGADTKAAAIRLMESMTPTEQLDYVEKYLKPFKGKLKTLDDVYMAVLYPKAIGKDSEYALFKKGTTAYWQNKGLDIDKDGIVTKAEAASKVRKYGVTTA